LRRQADGGRRQGRHRGGDRARRQLDADLLRERPAARRGADRRELQADDRPGARDRESLGSAGLSRAAPRARHRVGLFALLLAAGVVLVAEAVGDWVTVDEFAHLPAGVYYLRTGHFELYDLSPPLLRELAALPVLAARPAGDFADFTTHPEHWELGYEFMEK